MESIIIKHSGPSTSKGIKTLLYPSKGSRGGREAPQKRHKKLFPLYIGSLLLSELDSLYSSYTQAPPPNPRTQPIQSEFQLSHHKTRHATGVLLLNLIPYCSTPGNVDVPLIPFWTGSATGPFHSTSWPLKQCQQRITRPMWRGRWQQQQWEDLSRRRCDALCRGCSLSCACQADQCWGGWCGGRSINVINRWHPIRCCAQRVFYCWWYEIFYNDRSPHE